MTVLEVDGLEVSDLVVKDLEVIGLVLAGGVEIAVRTVSTGNLLISGWFQVPLA